METSRKQVIQVIDDDGSMRELLRTFLEDRGYKVWLSENGLEGLDEARHLHPDLILLDLRLPGRPGEEVCKAIREDENEAVKRTPILMLTGKDSDVDRVIGMVIGANGYLTKPFSMSKLLMEVRRCLNHGGGPATLAA
jgi:DNA-binding response OmpR family regulator